MSRHLLFFMLDVLASFRYWLLDKVVFDHVTYIIKYDICTVILQKNAIPYSSVVYRKIYYIVVVKVLKSWNIICDVVFYNLTWYYI